MKLRTKMLLWFICVWTATSLVDIMFQVHNSAFNAALAVMAALCCAADNLTESKPHPQKEG